MRRALHDAGLASVAIAITMAMAAGCAADNTSDATSASTTSDDGETGDGGSTAGDGDGTSGDGDGTSGDGDGTSGDGDGASGDGDGTSGDGDGTSGDGDGTSGDGDGASGDGDGTSGDGDGTSGDGDGTSGDGDGASGDGDGTSGDGDGASGDGDGTSGDGTSGDGDGDGTSGDGTSGDGDGDGTSGDGDGASGDGTSGDGDGDGASGDGTSGDGDGDGDGDDPCAPTVWNPADFNEVYDVGPTFAYATPSDVPWESIGPGTLVRIHWRATPYADKWVIATPGTAADPVVVTGVPSPLGELPIITGEDAQTRQQLDFWNERRGLIKLGGASSPGGPTSWVYVENLHLRRANPDYSFTDDAGGGDTYASNAAGLYVEDGANLFFRGNEIEWNGNGIFSGSQSSDVTVACNYVHDNGIPGSIFEHNSYTETARITFEYNRYGPPCPTCLGNNLKDRSSGTVVRYNWIEGGNRQLDLVDSDDAALVGSPEYDVTHVYGNVLVEPDGAGNRQIIHYGGDGSDTGNYRLGTLHLYANTVVSTRVGRTTLLRLSTDDPLCDARNNAIYVTAGGGELSMLDGSGDLELRDNWLPAGWVDTFGTLSGTLSDLGNVEGVDPGFENLGTQDFRPAPGSPLRGQAGALAAGVPMVDYEYVTHTAARARPDDGAPDIGAHEGD